MWSGMTLLLVAATLTRGERRWSDASWQVGTLRGPAMDAWSGNAVLAGRLREWLQGDRGPFLVSRLSLGSELSVAFEFACLGMVRGFSDVATLRSHAGVYPATDDAALTFAKTYVAAVNASDGGVVAVFGGAGASGAREAEVLRAVAPRATFVGNRALEPFYFPETPWSAVLRGRRVLVVHPFADTIAAQYAKHVSGARVWPGDVLPPMDLVLLKSVVSLGTGRPPHATWAESLALMKTQIDAALPFDVALLGCGAYGLPLAHHVLDRGATAIYVGGALQLLFGIQGTRWATRSFFQSRTNEHWVWPHANETPPGASAVEGAAYWRPALPGDTARR